jgi:hypothetical protein
MGGSNPFVFNLDKISQKRDNLVTFTLEKKILKNSQFFGQKMTPKKALFQSLEVDRKVLKVIRF